MHLIELSAETVHVDAMNHFVRTFGFSFLLVLLSGLASADALAPDTILPFHASAASPGFVPATGADTLPEGPAAIAPRGTRCFSPTTSTDACSSSIATALQWA